MDFLCPDVSTTSLLCEENCESIFGFSDSEGEAPESNMDLGLSTFVDLYLESSDDFVGSLVQQEKEQLACIATGDYLEKLNNGGIESAWRADAIEWFGKVQARYNFGPLYVYLAANFLDRFLSSNVPDDKHAWAQQALSVACLAIAAKMEETVVPSWADLLQVCNVRRHLLDVKTIERMEIFVLGSVNWRTNAVTPFSYISHLADKFNEGYPLTNEHISRCTELILGTLKETKFLQFMPSEIAAAVILYAVSETKVFDASSALLASEIPLDKEKVLRCHGAIQQVALVEMSSSSASPSPVPKSPSDVLNASCFSSVTDSQTPGSSEATNDSSATSDQLCTPVSKRTRL